MCVSVHTLVHSFTYAPCAFVVHWYMKAHKLHHKSMNPGPWSGLSMHPIEHFLYYSCAWLPALFMPLHPVCICTCACGTTRCCRTCCALAEYGGLIVSSLLVFVCPTSVVQQRRRCIFSTVSFTRTLHRLVGTTGTTNPRQTGISIGCTTTGR